VTSAWDQHQSVVSALGDRFALLRVDSTVGREEAGRQAIQNISHEPQMRAELAEAMGGLVASVDPNRNVSLAPDDVEQLLKAADLTTRCRTAVEFDYKGEVLEAHLPEAPTRFAKELAQLSRQRLTARPPATKRARRPPARNVSSAVRVTGGPANPGRQVHTR
jgi:hypothetical protein